MDLRIPIEKSVLIDWSAIAQGSRLSNHVLQHTSDPVKNSKFDQVNKIYTHEKCSDWHRTYLNSALEHLLFWSDAVIPLKFEEDRDFTMPLRPSYTLGRAAMEAASQALWISSAETAQECSRRHLSLVRWDFDELRKSDPDPEFKAAVKKRDQLLLERVSGTFTADDLRPPKHFEVLRAAAPIAELNSDKVESVWRAASGAAHGKNWPALHLQHVIPTDEYEPGQFRTLQFPDLEAITEVMTIASQMTSYGVLRHADFGGSDIGSLMEAAREWLANEISFCPDADPNVVARLKSPRDETPSS